MCIMAITRLLDCKYNKFLNSRCAQGSYCDTESKKPCPKGSYGATTGLKFKQIGSFMTNILSKLSRIHYTLGIMNTLY